MFNIIFESVNAFGGFCGNECICAVMKNLQDTVAKVVSLPILTRATIPVTKSMNDAISTWTTDAQLWISIATRTKTSSSGRT